MLPLLMLLIPVADAPRKPNIVLILADDLGWADLGCYGSKFHKTPRLDRMAAQGFRFTNAYASCPVCSPTRAALLTGKAPPRTGITDFLTGRPDRPDQPLARPTIAPGLALEHVTLATRLRAAGYATAHIGKWHLGGKATSPEKHGFDLNIAGDQAGSPRSYFSPFRNKKAVIPGLEKAPAREYLTDRLTDEAIKFIEAQRARPFFLYLSHYAVHIPLRAKAEHLKKYPGRLVLGRQSNPTYAAMLDSLDENVGRILDKLAALKLDESTLVVFTSDNGGLSVLEGPNTPATSNSPLREGKGFLYEGGIRVPLLIRQPGAIKPGVCTEPVISTDLFSTLLARCGVKATGDGIDLAMALEGKALPARPLFWHYPHYSNQGGKPGGAIREGKWKLVEFYENDRRELFDLSKDAGEHRNLAAQQPGVVKDLAAKLAAWRKEVKAKMPTPNPGYRPNPQDAAGNIVLHARTATVHGTQLRYEPQPHKLTLGYWSDAKDHATWELTVTKPGTFDVVLLQGCGKAQGGSLVEIELAGQKLSHTVRDTGGWQRFKPVEAGKVRIEKPGRYTLLVRAKKKQEAAVMDLREVRLTRVADRAPGTTTPGS